MDNTRIGVIAVLVTLGLFLFVGAVVWLASGGSPSSSSAWESPSPAASVKDGAQVTADQLLADYQADPAKADRKYKGRKLVVSGNITNTIMATNAYPFNSASFSNKNRAEPFNVECNFSLGKTDAVSSLLIGHPATISGECRGINARNVVLKDCDVIRK